MKLTDVPEGADFLDVDGIPVARLPDGSCIAFEKSDAAADSRPYTNAAKAGAEGDKLTRAEFQDWLSSGVNRFDVVR